MPQARRVSSADFAYEVGEDFQGPEDGVAPQWAAAHPKQWDEEDDRIVLASDDEDKPDRYTEHITAKSRDDQLLAVSYGKAVLVYGLQDKQLRQTIRVATERIEQLWIASKPAPASTEGSSEPVQEEADAGTAAAAAYTLIIATGHRPASIIILCALDATGRLLSSHIPLDTTHLTQTAVDSIRASLSSTYGVTPSAITTLGIDTGFKRALDTAEPLRARAHHRTLASASLASFSATPLDATETRLLYLATNGNTQQGMRPASELPHAVIYDLRAHKEIARLGGHTDAIMWAGFSPDDARVATVAWDGSMRVYDITEEGGGGGGGKLGWTARTGEGQGWAAAFSADSEYIAWSGPRGSRISVHRVCDGAELAVLAESEVKLTDWVRRLTWHPTSGRYLAFVCDATVYVWEPFGSSEGGQQRIVQRFGLGGSSASLMYNPSLNMHWSEDGTKAMVSCAEGTVEVWDMQTNRKWRMMRPAGRTDRYAGALNKPYLVKKDDKTSVLVSTGGDGVVRFWNLE